MTVESAHPAPADEHNEKLLANVHPAAWKNPRADGRYNMVVSGAGTAGLVTAIVAAGLGAKVALFERHLLGGDCLNYGCVPSKGVLRAARAAADVRDAGRFGVRVPKGVQVDFGAAMARMRRLRYEISRHDAAERFRKEGVDVYLGSASFTGPDTVEVGGQTLRFSRACIASGARAAAPPISGLEDAGYLTNETIFSLTELPRRLGVIGGGPIGCEMAQAFARFGSEVVQLEMGEHVLGRDDPDAAARVQAALIADGVRVITGAQVGSVSRESGGRRVTFRRGASEESVVVDEILVAVGRAPNVEGLGLDQAGVRYGRRGVEVDDHLRTSNRRVYAAGDVCFAFKFTHTADALAGIVIRNALFFGRARASKLVIPWCTYTDPELAHVGLDPSQATQQGMETDTYSLEFDLVDRPVLEGDDRGLAKIHVRRGSDRIVGATVVGRHAGELISEITLAMTHGLGLAKIAGTIHPYPTKSEVWRKLANAYMKTRLTPGARRWISRILSWRR